MFLFTCVCGIGTYIRTYTHVYKHICIDTDKFLLLLGVPRSCNTLVAISTPSILFRVPMISKYHAQIKTNCALLGEVVESKTGQIKCTMNLEHP